MTWRGLFALPVKRSRFATALSPGPAKGCFSRSGGINAAAVAIKAQVHVRVVALVACHQTRLAVGVDQTTADRLTSAMTGC